MKPKKIENVKVGDRFTLLACYFHVPGWTDGQPCVLLSPALRYDETNGADSTVADVLEDLVCEGKLEIYDDDYDDVEKCLNWVGKSVKSVKRAVSKSLKTGKKPYKDVYSEIVKMEVEIVEDEDGDLDWKELSRIYI